MPLEPAFVPVVFDKALDQKTNYKLAVPGSFLTLDNAVRHKTGLWEKRDGFQATQSPPLTTGKSLGQINDGLCYMDGTYVNTYGPTANSWSTASGYAVPVQFTCTPAVRYTSSWGNLTLQPSSAQAGGLIMTVCATSISGAQVTVTDAATGTVLVAPMTVPYGFSNCRVVALGSTFLLFGNRQSGIFSCVAIPASSLSTNNQMQVLTGITPVAIVSSNQTVYDVAVYDSGAAMLVYHNSSHKIVVAPILASGAVGNGSNGYPAPVTIGSTPSVDMGAACLGVFCTNQYTFVAYCSGTDTNLYGQSYNPGLTTPQSWTLATGATQTRNVCFFTYVKSGIQLVSVLYEVGHPSTAADGANAAIYVTKWFINSGTVSYGTTPTLVTNGLGLVSKVWVGTDGQPYSLVAHDSNLQPSCFLVRWYTDPNSVFFVVETLQSVAHFQATGSGGGLSRSFQNFTGNQYGPWLADVALDASGNAYCPAVVVTQETANVSGVYTIVSTGIDLYKLAVGSRFSRTNLGQTLQLTAGRVSDYDGANARALGFDIFPETMALTTTSGGSLSAGTYYFKTCFESVDNQGNIHRSTVSPPASIVVSASGSITVTPAVGATVYFSSDNFLFYKQGVGNLTITTGPNQAAPLLYTVGGVLDNDPVPACNVSHVHKNRLWLGGLESNDIWFSKEFKAGFGIAFSQAFTIPIDSASGPVTAFATLDDKLIIFKRDRIYFLVGEGPNDAGNEWDYPEPIAIPTDVGTTLPHSVCLLPGGVMFKSARGWYMLTRGLQLNYVGAAVEDYNGLTATSATLISDRSEVRFLHSNGVALVYNYLYNQWSTFSNYQGYDSVVCLGGAYYRLGTDGLVYKDTPGQYLDNGARIQITVETSWLSMAKLEGYQRVYSLQLLADFVADHQLELSIAYDFQNTYNQVITYTTTGNISGTTMTLRIRPRIQKCSAIKLKLRDLDNVSVAGSACLKPTSLALEVGRKKGSARLPTAQSI